MGDRFHIIITGEDGRTSRFQFSRRKVFLTVAACSVIFIGASIMGLTAVASLFSNQNLSQKIEKLNCELARNEKAAAIYQAQIVKLEESKNSQIESLKRDYEYKLHSQQATYDLENTTLQLENVELMNSAINDLNARSDLIESVMDNIGIQLIKAAEQSPENSGGPYIPAKESSYTELVNKVDDYLNIIKYMPLGKPIEGQISSKFGTRVDPMNGKKSIHEGVDIKGRRGAEIRSTADGVVTKAFKNGGYGKYVEINHGNGYVTAFAHMQSYLVKKGDRVKRGQVIGKVGSSGRSTGPHLHYEIRLHKKPVSPDKFMKVADLTRAIPVEGPGHVQK
jgi:murein DD-endopeptidase MepM/ murein hydrolase activator NlpD